MYTIVPTTAGTGSETTGTAILDITSRNFKTGIANRAMKPVLGIVDTLNTDTCPTAVHISAGLDVLCHSLESYTAIPCVQTIPRSFTISKECLSYYERMPRPANPILRPAYQGSNPVADVFSRWALQTCVEYLPRVAKNPDDREARRQMLSVTTFPLNKRSADLLVGRLASSFAGIGFGNAGVHLCHGISYPVASRFSLGNPPGANFGFLDLGLEQKGSKVQTSRICHRWTHHTAWDFVSSSENSRGTSPTKADSMQGCVDGPRGLRIHGPFVS